MRSVKTKCRYCGRVIGLKDCGIDIIWYHLKADHLKADSVFCTDRRKLSWERTATPRKRQL